MTTYHLLLIPSERPLAKKKITQFLTKYQPRKLNDFRYVWRSDKNAVQTIMDARSWIFPYTEALFIVGIDGQNEYLDYAPGASGTVVLSKTRKKSKKTLERFLLSRESDLKKRFRSPSQSGRGSV